MKLGKEIYFTAFRNFYKAAGADWPSAVNEWKGVVGLALIESSFLMGMGLWVNILLGKFIFLSQPKWVIVAGFTILCLWNYYILIARGHGLIFESNFAKLQKAKRVRLQTYFVILTPSAVGFFSYTAYVHRNLIVIKGT